ncbi:ER protein folding protein [Schizosaccharomyces cryophilus OY26]|uniref:ER protein folding protein n=1 Tax=Schizosaccharomyces cryophilus (strain OY26 / ATCC MYA-4695 / CBS 11777 / NBRC 106824 / NRRL Y48691) TaxID=653667 RepID=S9W727_SCHCR|nr:ER protein folding protein [Schizosaccharomyces cryophilus OY26]EPY53685.1 ER protein folding protein [Schizosaccharomyces cryophilus OY26]
MEEINSTTKPMDHQKEVNASRFSSNNYQSNSPRDPSHESKVHNSSHTSSRSLPMDKLKHQQEFVIIQKPKEKLFPPLLNKRSASAENLNSTSHASSKSNLFPKERSHPTFVPPENNEPKQNHELKEKPHTMPASKTQIAGLRMRSFWDYVRLELTASDTESANPIKQTMVEDFFATPLSIEKTLLYGWFVCVDSFLYVFTLLPIRIFLSILFLFHYIFHNTIRFLSPGNKISPIAFPKSRKIDLIKVSLLLSTSILIRRLDVSRLYHVIRAQASIRFYVLYNVLEIADRLCGALGQDVLDCLFADYNLSFHFLELSGWLRFFYYYFISLAYMVLHTLVLLYQIVTLNVTVNSYSNAVLALLMSNQMVEIKGSVFKKFEKENLFQLTCSDIVERFQITVMATVIFLRNLTEMYTTSSLDAPLITFDRLKTLMAPFVWVIGSELFVDWLKHAFIIKFNYFKPSIYGRFTDVLCHDYVASGGRPAQTVTGKSQHVARRMGLPVLPLVCVFIRTSMQTWNMFRSTHSMKQEIAKSIGMLLPTKDNYIYYLPKGQTQVYNIEKEPSWESIFLSWLQGKAGIAVLFFILLMLKLILGMALLSFAQSRYRSMKIREEDTETWEKERKTNNFFRGHIEIDNRTKTYLNNSKDDLPVSKGQLLTLERYSMFSKRIW